MWMRCIRECFDGTNARKYYREDEADIGPENPIKKYFVEARDPREPEEVPEEEEEGEEREED